MFRLASMLYALVATAISGTAVIAVLSAGMVTVPAIVGAAAIGAVVAAPASWLIAKRLYQN
ncbi:hypothetical protein TRL7639_02958 [Falsiruegeria litorea R37]|uniref:CTP synthetase n=1 Tax=Falsiruegeria litorea R37 TaxID=1200284 RepID=A0A1Y5T497_9RHOB|nr:hypothetical protein [Falsiruegeria litorea]SLN55455.1 hypothetical protein TRL7639_02958 [Falsiruegeria litorea R37]